MDSGLERPTAIYWLSTNQTQSRQNQEKVTAKKTKQTIATTEPTLESRIRKERESQELDENSKSTLECLSSWCQVLKEWRRCSSYGNPCKELAIHLHWHRRDPMKGPITSPPVHGNLYKWKTHPPTESTWQSYGWSIRRPSCIWICWFQWMCSKPSNSVFFLIKYGRIHASPSFTDELYI